MTPMVDLAFLLLTFFVLTTTLNKGMVMDLHMPEKLTQTPPPPIEAKEALTLVLGNNDQIFWYTGVPNGETQVTNYSSIGIRKILNEKKASIKGLVVLIKPSQQSQYKNVVDLLDEILIADIKRYAIVDIEPQDLALLESR